MPCIDVQGFRYHIPVECLTMYVLPGDDKWYFIIRLVQDQSLVINTINIRRAYVNWTITTTYMYDFSNLDQGVHEMIVRKQNLFEFLPCFVHSIM